MKSVFRVSSEDLPNIMRNLISFSFLKVLELSIQLLHHIRIVLELAQILESEHALLSKVEL